MIRPATASDADSIWQIIEPIIRDGETYAIDRDITRDDALVYWMESPELCLVAEVDKQILGTYYLKVNQRGGGDHVCNCGYMVAPAAQGRGIARAMCEDSLKRAREAGYEAMQFNFVVSTNTRAINLWERLGFDVVGRLPHSFRSPSSGLVDALVMFRKL